MPVEEYLILKTVLLNYLAILWTEMSECSHLSGRNPTQSGLGQSGVGNENVLAHIKKKQTQRESFSIMDWLSNAFKAQSHGLSISQLRFIGINCIVSHTLLCSSYNHHD